VHAFISGIFEAIENDFEEEVESNISEKGAITEDEIKKIIAKDISEYYELWEKADNIPSLPASSRKSAQIEMTSHLSP
jgi:hypothetical protein